MVVSKKLFSLIFLLFSFSYFFSQNVSNSETVDMQKLSVENQSEPLDENYFDSSETYDFNTEDIDSPSTFGLFFRMIVVLIIVVAFIYLLFFFIKKKTNFVKEDDDFLRRVAYLNLGPGKTVEVVTLIDKAYLIGVTDDKISLLGEIDDKELIQAMNLNADKNKNIKKPTNFNDVLQMFMGSKSGSIYKDSDSNLNKFLKKK